MNDSRALIAAHKDMFLFAMFASISDSAASRSANISAWTTVQLSLIRCDILIPSSSQKTPTAVPLSVFEPSVYIPAFHPF